MRRKEDAHPRDEQPNGSQHKYAIYIETAARLLCIGVIFVHPITLDWSMCIWLAITIRPTEWRIWHRDERTRVHRDYLNIYIYRRPAPESVGVGRGRVHLGG